jgi:3-phenylpropionate/cinnamic acid dioxygenase small subunit
MNEAALSVEARLRRLEDRSELRELVARYAIAIDDRDIDAIAELFTADGSFRSQDGVMNATGRFADRLLSFLYYLPVTEYAEGLGDRLRMRAYGDRRPADFPEALATWKHYHGEG